jgi:hypothetical protein
MVSGMFDGRAVAAGSGKQRDEEKNDDVIPKRQIFSPVS